jgi:hypothetical protein
MLEQKNEALERLMDGGDDASSVNLFGKAINVEARQASIPLAIPEDMKAKPIRKLKIRRVILCLSLLTVGTIATLIFWGESKRLVVRPPILVNKPVETVKKTDPIPQQEAMAFPTPSTERIDLDALKKLLDQSIGPNQKSTDAKRNIDLSSKQKLMPVLKPQNVQTTTQIRKVIEPKIITLPNYSGAASIENSPVNKSDNVAKQIQPIQMVPPAVVGDKLSSGETVLSVSLNGDIVTDMRIIKKGQK